MTLYTNDYLEYYLTLVGWIINNGIWAMISDTGPIRPPLHHHRYSRVAESPW